VEPQKAEDRTKTEGSVRSPCGKGIAGLPHQVSVGQHPGRKTPGVIRREKSPGRDRGNSRA